jgi:hypothetical protein
MNLGNQNGGTLILDANKQWMSRPADQRFQTLDDLRDALSARRNASRAVNMDLEEIRSKPTDDGQGIVINSGLTPARPSHWSFGQLARLVSAPAEYLRRMPVELACRCLNESIDQTNEDRGEMKLMTIRDEEGGLDTLQAVTSTTYGRIWDADVASAVSRIVDRSGGRFFNPKDWSGKPSGLYASDHDVFIFMVDGGSIVDGGGERDQMNRGFITWNSETGAKTFGLMTFLFRVVCGNHMIWDATDITKMIVRHTSGGPTRFDREAMPVLLNYVNASARPVEDAIRKAKEIRLLGLVNLPGLTVSRDPLNHDWQKVFAKAHGFTVGEVSDAIKFAKAEEGTCGSLWDIINGFTASARSIEFIDARIDLEKRASKLMDLAKN